MRSLAQDIKYSLRVIRRRPLASTVIVVMLALGVGANAAIFSVVNGVVLRPLAFPDPDRLVVVFEENVGEDLLRQTVSPPKLDDWEEQASSFERLAAYAPTAVGISGDFDPERVPSSLVTGEIFELLGIVPSRGRPFVGDELVDGNIGVAVVSNSLWRRKFGADPRLVGTTVQLNQQPHRIVGILPPLNEDIGLGEILLPFTERIDNRKIRFLNVLGRLRRGVTREQAQGEMDGLAARLAAAYPDSDSGWSIALVPLHEQLVGDVSRSLVVLLGAVGVVLLIACVNIVHLLLAGVQERRAEVLLRMSLGAPRSRIVRQLLTESAVLGAVGAVAAVLIGHWALRVLLAAAPAGLVRRTVPALDVTVLGFGLVLAIVATLLVGLVPALRLSRAAMAHGRSWGRPRGVLRPALLVAEVALAFVLVVGASLLIRSFATLTSVDPGFRPNGILTARVSLSPEQFPDDEDVRSFADQLRERIAALPGVTTAQIANSIPLTGGPWFNIETASPDATGESHAGPGPMRIVTPGYLGALGIELRAGRDFSEADRLDTPLVTILDEALAERLFPDGNALGKHVRTHYDEPAEREVIGIAGGVKQWGLNGMTSAGFYVPLGQVRWSTLYVVVRSEGNRTDVVGALQRAVWSLAPDVPVDAVRTLEEMLATSVGEPRFQALLLGLFGGVSLLLAIGGIAGVTLQSVGSRRGEIGIRMALGAGEGAIVRMVVRENLGFVAVGLICGIGMSYFAVRLIATMLFETDPLDPTIFAAVAALVSAVAGLASWLPSRRAALVDPAEAIRAV